MYWSEASLWFVEDNMISVGEIKHDDNGEVGYRKVVVYKMLLKKRNKLIEVMKEPTSGIILDSISLFVVFIYGI